MQQERPKGYCRCNARWLSEEDVDDNWKFWRSETKVIEKDVDSVKRTSEMKCCFEGPMKGSKSQRRIRNREEGGITIPAPNRNFMDGKGQEELSKGRRENWLCSRSKTETNGGWSDNDNVRRWNRKNRWNRRVQQQGSERQLRPTQQQNVWRDSNVRSYWGCRNRKRKGSTMGLDATTAPDAPTNIRRDSNVRSYRGHFERNEECRQRKWISIRKCCLNNEAMSSAEVDKRSESAVLTTKQCRRRK